MHGRLPRHVGWHRGRHGAALDGFRADSGERCAHTADLPPEDLGRVTQMRMVAEGVIRALAYAGIENAADVHLVQINVRCSLRRGSRPSAVPFSRFNCALRHGELDGKAWLTRPTCLANVDRCFER